MVNKSLREYGAYNKECSIEYMMYSQVVMMMFNESVTVYDGNVY